MVTFRAGGRGPPFSQVHGARVDGPGKGETSKDAVRRSPRPGGRGDEEVRVRTAQSTLAVDVRRAPDEPGTVEVRLSGELDVTTSPLLQTVIEQVLVGRRTRRCSLLVLDMSGVSFADASGISPILLARALVTR